MAPRPEHTKSVRQLNKIAFFEKKNAYDNGEHIDNLKNNEEIKDRKSVALTVC